MMQKILRYNDNTCSFKHAKVFNHKEFEIPHVLRNTTFQSFSYPDSNIINKDSIFIVSLRNTNSDKKNEDLFQNGVISIKKQDEKIYVKTGNYIGVVYDKDNNLKIEITSRFGELFLQHLLRYVNNIFIPDIITEAKNKNTKDYSQFQFILAHLFIQALDKSVAIFGIPKMYNSYNQNSYTLKGKININHLMQNNIPLRTKLQSSYNKQIEIQEIIDVLDKAMTIIDKKFKETTNNKMSSIKQILKEKKSKKLVTKITIKKAKKHKVLHHPSYQSFREVLKYAEMIILQYDLIEDISSINKTQAYLIDVAELFEIYIEKVLRKGLNEDGWSVFAQKEIDTYNKNFFKRKLKPDIVLEKDNKVIVFDTKYKSMIYRGTTNLGMGDVDRNDFFQIHTYMSYYQNQSEKKLLGGGLLYPIEGKETQNAYASLFDNKESFFIIDGINLNGINDETSQEEFKKRENDFIDRIKKIINKNYD